jgi:uncharacterized membrane protein
MKTPLLVLAVLAFLVGALVLVSAQSAIQEIVACVLFVCSSVFLAGSGIVGAVNEVRDRLGSSTTAPRGTAEPSRSSQGTA